MPSYAISKHAASRAVDMALSADQIIAAVERPRWEFWSERTQSWQYTNNKVTACLRLSDAGVWTVTTFLWAKPSGWIADAEYDPIVGRREADGSGARSVVRAMKRNRH